MSMVFLYGRGRRGAGGLSPCKNLQTNHNWNFLTFSATFFCRCPHVPLAPSGTKKCHERVNSNVTKIHVTLSLHCKVFRSIRYFTCFVLLINVEIPEVNDTRVKIIFAKSSSWCQNTDYVTSKLIRIIWFDNEFCRLFLFSSLSLSLCLALSLSHTHTHEHTHTLSLSLTHTQTHTLSLSHTHTHKHTLSLSLLPTPPCLCIFRIIKHQNTAINSIYMCRCFIILHSM